MPKRLSVSVLVEVPDDPFAAADIYKQLQPSWQSLLEALKASGTQYDLKMSEMEVRKPVVRRPRKPRLVTPPTGEAA
jgi:hypothetical protein